MRAAARFDTDDPVFRQNLQTQERVGIFAWLSQQQEEVVAGLGGSEFEAERKQTDAFAESAFPEGAQLCAKCNHTAVVLLDGCMTCLNCGDSKCG